jgi:hypothetical protein
MVPDLPAGAIGMGRVGPAASDGTYERSLVDILCEPGGLKAVPPEALLQDFLTSAITLSPELIGNCLLDMLNADAWQSRTKALLVIQAFVTAKECAGHVEWWREQTDSLRSLGADSKAGVRAQAVKTLRALGEQDAGIESVQSSRSVAPKLPFGTAAPAAAAPGDVLLDILDRDSALDSRQPSGTHAAPPLPVATAEDSSSALFAGMALCEAPVTTPPPVPPTPAAPAVSTAVSSFDFLSDSLSSAVPPPVPPAAAAAGTALDFFADLSPALTAHPLHPAPSTPAAGYHPQSTMTMSMSSGRDQKSSISSAFVQLQTGGAKTDHRDAFQEVSSLGHSMLGSLLTCLRCSSRCLLLLRLLQLRPWLR